MIRHRLTILWGAERCLIALSSSSDCCLLSWRMRIGRAMPTYVPSFRILYSYLPNITLAWIIHEGKKVG